MEDKAVLSISRRDIVTFIAGAACCGSYFLVAGLATPPNTPTQINTQPISQYIKKINVPIRVKMALVRLDLDHLSFINDFYANLQNELEAVHFIEIAVENIIARDYETDAVIFLDGWAISNTEAAIALLS